MIDESTTTQEEQHEPKPERVVEAGEWFRPFEDYENIPNSVERDGYLSRAIEFNIGSTGKFTIESDWIRDDDFGADKRKAIIILPSSEQEIRKEQFSDYQERFELRLFDLSIFTDSPKVVSGNSLHRAELRLPSGRVLFSRFREPTNEGDASFAEHEWHDTEGDKGGFLLIPDTGNIFGRLEMRIVSDNSSTV